MPSRRGSSSSQRGAGAARRRMANGPPQLAPQLAVYGTVLVLQDRGLDPRLGGWGRPVGGGRDGEGRALPERLEPRPRSARRARRRPKPEDEIVTTNSSTCARLSGTLSTSHTRRVVLILVRLRLALRDCMSIVLAIRTSRRTIGRFTNYSHTINRRLKERSTRATRGSPTSTAGGRHSASAAGRRRRPVCRSTCCRPWSRRTTAACRSRRSRTGPAGAWEARRRAARQ